MGDRYLPCTGGFAGIPATREESMLTFTVDQKDVDVLYTLKELKDFSLRRNVRVIIKDFCTLEQGGVIRLV